jgi:uncharacterized membrane protein
MAKVEVTAVHRIIREFVSGQQFAITSSSLEALADIVARRLNAHPEEINAVIADVRKARDVALRDSAQADVVQTATGPLRLLHEWDAGKITRDCDSYPPI